MARTRLMYLLDTNACIQVLNYAGSPVARRLASHAPGEITICLIVKAELFFGAHKSTRAPDGRQTWLATLAAFVAPLRSLPFDDEAAEAYGRIRAQMAAVGQPIGPNDLLIGLERGYIEHPQRCSVSTSFT